MRSTRKRVVAITAAAMAVVLVGVGVAVGMTFHGFERISPDVDGAREQLGVSPHEMPSTGDLEFERPEFDLELERPEFDLEFERPDGEVEVYLIVGSDGRPGVDSSRADAILLGILPASRDDEPVLVSLPRDLWIDDLCAGGRQRINVALGGCGSRATGEELMILTVEEFTGLSVDHFVKVDFEGFTKVVDAVGGVEICTDRPVRDRHLSLPGGCVQADGEVALEWVRSRRTQEKIDGVWRTMPDVNDLTRNERQQDVLLQVFERATSRWSLPQLYAATRSLSDTVVLDDSLGLDDMVSTAWRWRGVDASTIRRVSLDVEPHTTSGGAEVLLPRTDFDEQLASAGVELDGS